MLAATMGEEPVRGACAGSRCFGRVAVRLDAAGPAERAVASASASPVWLRPAARCSAETGAVCDSAFRGWLAFGVDGGSGAVAVTLCSPVRVSSATSCRTSDSSLGRSSRLRCGNRRTATVSELLAPDGRGTNSGEKAGLVELPGV